MTTTPTATGLGSTALALRDAFDRSFAEERGTAAPPAEDLLLLQVGGDPHLVRMAEISALYADHKIVPVPTASPELLGIAGFRNGAAPIFDLRLLLGYPAGPAPRWLVLARAAQPVGLAFDRYEGHVRIDREQLSSTTVDNPVRPNVRGAVQVGAVIRPAIHIASVLEAIARRFSSGRPPRSE